MAEITVELIKTLREKTNAGMMDCKAALTEAKGDLAEAEVILRKKGITGAEKKAGRATSEGVIAARIDADAKTGVLVAVSCETDFVAKNENFQSFVDGLVNHVATAEPVADLDALLAQTYVGDPSLTVTEVVKAKIGQLGENMALSRFARYTVDGEGVIASYIHPPGKVGVLLEAGCTKAATADAAAFREVVKDIALHIAAAQPLCVTRDEVPAAKVEQEKEIYREKAKGKPENIVEKIVAGQIDKFFASMALLEQGFIKDPDKTIKDLLAAKGKEVGDELTIRRFARFAVGEEG
ncbi:MAG: elongation factor Ts [Verrucomicrobiales bacterium]|nr:elongation factor Ts [Verrucomicrobiales bacterium]